MNSGRHIVGIGFILISALLYLADYAVVVAYGFTITAWGDLGRLGTSAARYSSPLLVNLSIAALTIGIVYLIAAEVVIFLQHRKADA